MSFVVAALVCLPLTSALADCRPLTVDGGPTIEDCRAQKRRVVAFYLQGEIRAGILAECRRADA